MTQSTNPDRVLEGKVIIVTGAGRGIGRGIAMLAAQHGAKVVVNDVGANGDGKGKDGSPADDVVTEIRQAGGEAVANTDSVAEYSAAEKIVACAMDTFGRLDGVMNNAGILRDTIFHKLDPADWEAVIGVNLHGPFNVSRAAAPHFRNQSSGAFVHMTSASALIGNLAQAHYSAAKLGVVALSKSIALDMERYSVRSNCICPFAWTRLVATIPGDTPEEKARVERMQQMSPDKIAPLAVSLLSDLAASVNGQVFASRNHEIFLMGQPRPLRGMQRSDGWTPHQIATHAFPAMAAQFYPLDRSNDVFGWDPV
ncbi:MAG TPA: 3-hydroxyacyl-CoA dehydrogenase [Rhodospirillaceae bacterium]|jgi:NAD(P)-dependent dehydrogenase (short-subunit alcohol dehydrogenase family)|nr:3-hydroxyacyl-CoA dehydrogenase [Rhodospirillaceae bacterium]MAX62659.1 3-hydroxyacyl-CoA dehydrogenase [Rhodospirillaceae bacterium]HAJ21651.1 3-hydroxyacyl-CoA dehydrogenase [Rhodospirillaceae bacterium]HBM12548.1 3-hydroxyacyl-CoA dehydrogenase [Rhodospirillaceae bacterium]|tara:strand:- start:71157 stop:72089 length:933 start_codon:yes stop_codon:yes gene_type:complete